MLVPLSWLKEYVDVEVGINELCDKMVNCGFEIEKIIDLSQNIKNVVTAKIMQIEKHPDADRLQICQLDIGSDNLLQVVTAATNIKVGDTVPVALDGAKLPDGTVIKKGKLRNVKSDGMMCGGEELGLTENDYKGAGVDGILILEPNLNAGIDINKVIGTDDIVLDVGITANRPDCNGIYFLAHEVAACLGKKVKPLKLNYKVSDEENDVKVEIKDLKLCPHYMAGKVKNIQIKDSPRKIKNRLRACGVRPINNIVDITNYILFELGQPMHAFDYNNIKNASIKVRCAEKKEKITTLDDKERSLSENNLLICDDVKPIAIAGIMGGKYSSINSETDTIVFESAKFARDNIRRSSRELNLKSDSSSRYEKGVSSYLQETAIKRAFALIDETSSGEICKGVFECGTGDDGKKSVNASMEKINEILGVNVEFTEAKKILKSLNFEVKGTKNAFTVTPPSVREDINTVNDIAEEVIRFYGYDKIDAILFKDAHQTSGKIPDNFSVSGKIKNLLADKGLNEIVTYSFTSPEYFKKLNILKDEYADKHVKIVNPLGEQVSVMRTTLVHSMLETVASNMAKGNKKGGLFEIAKIYLPEKLPLEKLPKEKDSLIISMFGGFDFYDLKGIIESLYDKVCIDTVYKSGKVNYMHPYRCAEIFSGEQLIGRMGEISPEICDNYAIKGKIYIAELDMEFIRNNFKTYRQFVKPVKFPSADRDIALIVDEKVNASDIIDLLKRVGGKILESVLVFDVYSGKQIESGKKSMAFSLTFRANDRTLSDEEINRAMDKILKQTEIEFSAKLR